MRRSSRRLIVVMLMASLTVFLYDRIYPPDVISLGQMGIYSVDIHDHDVIVLLDIQATGMTSLSRALMHDLVTDASCFCPPYLSRCSCRNSYNNQWLFNAYNATGWVCGEHADFTTLTKCPIDYWFENVSHDNRDYRKYVLMTMLREPASRFIAEWRHLVQEDTYFKNEPRLFRNESLELQKKRLPCLLGVKVEEMSLEKFLECKENPAINRQTRMLANLTEVNKHGYHGDRYNNLLLASAVRTLESLPFFGVYDRPSDTQMLLEMTLSLQFSRPLLFYKDGDDTPLNSGEIPGPLLRRIRLANHLDARLYSHALFLFQSRVRAVTNPRHGDVVPQSETAKLANSKLMNEDIPPASATQQETNKNIRSDKATNDNIVIESKSDDEHDADNDNVENYRDGAMKADKTNLKSGLAFSKGEGDFDNTDLLSFIDAINEGKMDGVEKIDHSEVVEGYTEEEVQKPSLNLNSYNDRPAVSSVVREFQPLSMENKNEVNSAKSDDPTVDDDDDDDNGNEELIDFLRSNDDHGEEIENSLEDGIEETSLKSYGQNWEKAKDYMNMASEEDNGEKDLNLRYFETSAEVSHSQSQPTADKTPDGKRRLENGFGGESMQRLPAKNNAFGSSLGADHGQFPTDTEDVNTFLSNLFHLKQQRQEQPFEKQQPKQQQPQLQQYQQQPYEQQQPQQQQPQLQQYQQQPYEQQQQQQNQHPQYHQQHHGQQQQQQQSQLQQYQQQPHEQQQQNQQPQYHQQHHGQQQQQYYQQLYQQYLREKQQQFQQQQYQQQQEHWHQETQGYLPTQRRATTAPFSTSKGANTQASASYSNVYFQRKPKAGFSGNLPSTSSESESKSKDRRALDVAKVQRMFV